MDLRTEHQKLKENFNEYQLTTRNEAWEKVASAVSILGTNKTHKHCKSKIRNLENRQKSR